MSSFHNKTPLLETTKETLLKLEENLEKNPYDIQSIQKQFSNFNDNISHSEIFREITSMQKLDKECVQSQQSS